MSKPFRIGVAGLGTVGAGVIRIIQGNKDLLARRVGRPVEISCVSARNKDRDRGIDLSGYDWLDNPSEMTGREDIDAVVELIGGADGIAYDMTRNALAAGKHVVTANKAMMAHHGYELASIAEKNGASLAYEAAVAGGIPIIKALREGFAANGIETVYGILNGTCNYILTEMRETGRDFDEVLKEAQEKGYAEADPTFDIDGIDAGHKLALLASIAFGTKPDFESLRVAGIRNINRTDIKFAEKLGYRIKLLGIARRLNGKIMQTLEPCLVPSHSPLGMIDDVYNAVFIQGDYVETPLLSGKGAGQGPTASSVVADIIDLARGFKVPAFGISAGDLADPDWIDLDETESSYYLRLTMLDQPGVIADVSKILKEYDISIESLLQQGRDPGQPVPVVLTTHETRYGSVVDACRDIENLNACIHKPCLIRIDQTE